MDNVELKDPPTDTETSDLDLDDNLIDLDKELGGELELELDDDFAVETDPIADLGEAPAADVPIGDIGDDLPAMDSGLEFSDDTDALGDLSLDDPPAPEPIATEPAPEMAAAPDVLAAEDPDDGDITLSDSELSNILGDDSLSAIQADDPPAEPDMAAPDLDDFGGDLATDTIEEDSLGDFAAPDTEAPDLGDFDAIDDLETPSSENDLDIGDTLTIDEAEEPLTLDIADDPGDTDAEVFELPEAEPEAATPDLVDIPIGDPTDATDDDDNITLSKDEIDNILGDDMPESSLDDAPIADAPMAFDEPEPSLESEPSLDDAVSLDLEIDDGGDDDAFEAGMVIPGGGGGTPVEKSSDKATASSGDLPSVYDNESEDFEIVEPDAPAPAAEADEPPPPTELPSEPEPDMLAPDLDDIEPSESIDDSSEEEIVTLGGEGDDISDQIVTTGGNDESGMMDLDDNLDDLSGDLAADAPRMAEPDAEHTMDENDELALDPMGDDLQIDEPAIDEPLAAPQPDADMNLVADEAALELDDPAPAEEIDLLENVDDDALGGGADAAEPFGFDDDEDEGPIALSQDELDNIMVDVEEEVADDAPQAPEESPLAEDEVAPSAAGEDFLDDFEDEGPIALSEEELTNIVGDIENVEPAPETGETHDANDDIFQPDQAAAELPEQDLSDFGSEPDEKSAGGTDERVDNIIQGTGIAKKDMQKMLSYLDSLFDMLPDSAIQAFSKSEYFNLYKGIMEELDL